MNDMDKEYMEMKELTENEPLLQLRNTTGSNTLHIQGWGKEGNRPYGYANKFSVPHEVTNALQVYVLDGKYQSLASDAKIYHRDCLIVTEYSDGWQLDIEVEDDHFVLDLDSTLAQSLALWCKENNLYRDKSAVKRVIPKKGDE
jgi:hypothetical protein